MKNKQINIRLTEKELAYIKRKSERAKMDTRLCHEGRITCLNLDELKEQVGNIWHGLNLLIDEKK